VWDVASERAIAVFRQHAGLVNTVATTADGNGILTASDDRTARLSWFDPWRRSTSCWPRPDGGWATTPRLAKGHPMAGKITPQPPQDHQDAKGSRARRSRHSARKP
jgi:WD40 repeat protein